MTSQRNRILVRHHPADPTANAESLTIKEFVPASLISWAVHPPVAPNVPRAPSVRTIALASIANVPILAPALAA